jgi:hypothetical protein
MVSPRFLSILCNNDIGKVIPSFSVLSVSVVLTIPVYLAILSYKSFLAIAPKTASSNDEFGAAFIHFNNQNSTASFLYNTIYGLVRTFYFLVIL